MSQTSTPYADGTIMKNALIATKRQIGNTPQTIPESSTSNRATLINVSDSKLPSRFSVVDTSRPGAVAAIKQVNGQELDKASTSIGSNRVYSHVSNHEHSLRNQNAFMQSHIIDDHRYTGAASNQLEARMLTPMFSEGAGNAAVNGRPQFNT